MIRFEGEEGKTCACGSGKATAECCGSSQSE